MPKKATGKKPKEDDVIVHFNDKYYLVDRSVWRKVIAEGPYAGPARALIVSGGVVGYIPAGPTEAPGVGGYSVVVDLSGIIRGATGKKPK